MSSLAASRADNFYFPPEWKPEFGGLSKFVGSKGSNQYQKYGILRFELPFDGWCLKCNNHMSKGTRFNAKKDKVGMYFTTKIFSFTTKCPSCDNQLVIKTDPQNNTYEFAEGLRKMEQDYEMQEIDGLINPLSDESKELLQVNPIFRLQHEKEDYEKGKQATERINDLYEHANQTTKNDYDLNSKLRNMNRLKRKNDLKLLQEGKSKGLSIPLIEPREEDTIRANEIMKQINLKKQRKKQSIFDKNERIRLITIQTDPPYRGMANK